jgi:hypothetical protein
MKENKMKNIIIIIMIFLLVNVSFAQNLEITIAAENLDFLQYEPIGLTYKIRNIGPDKIKLVSAPIGYFGLELLVKDSNGNRLMPFETSGYVGNIFYIEIMPGEEIVSYTDISAFGNLYGGMETVTLYRYYFAPDTLSLQLVYTIPKDIDKNNYEDIVFKSNIEEIVINKPSIEDETIIKDLQEVHNLCSSNQKRGEGIKKALKIVDNYPNHPLTKQAYLYLDSGVQRYYNFDLFEYYKKYCLDFPRTLKAIRWASSFIKQDSDFTQKILGTELYNRAIIRQKEIENKIKIMERDPNFKQTRSKQNEK